MDRVHANKQFQHKDILLTCKSPDRSQTNLCSTPDPASIQINYKKNTVVHTIAFISKPRISINGTLPLISREWKM